MKIHRTREMEIFERFLKNVNRFKKNDGVIVVDLTGMEERLFIETDWDSPDHYDDQNHIAAAILQQAVESFGPMGQDELCQFLFQLDSVSEIAENKQHPDERWNELRRATDAYSQFADNYTALNIVMMQVQTHRDNGTLPLKNARRSIFGIKRLVFVALDSDQKIEQRPEPLFYGFTDFARVKFCKQCQDYFLAKRTDAEYCSEACGTAFRQKTYQANHAKTLKKKRETYQKNRADILANRSKNRDYKKGKKK